MIKTDPVTAVLMDQFVKQEEEKETGDTLYRSLLDTHQKITAICGSPQDEDPETGLPRLAFTTTALILRKTVEDEIKKRVNQLADTLALARDIHEKPTPARLKKLRRMAEKAADGEEIKLKLLCNAVASVDFEYIAEVVLGVGKRRTDEAQTKQGSGCA